MKRLKVIMQSTKSAATRKGSGWVFICKSYVSHIETICKSYVSHIETICRSYVKHIESILKCLSSHIALISLSYSSHIGGALESIQGLGIGEGFDSLKFIPQYAGRGPP